MSPKVIVMIITLAMPNGDSGVHVKPMPTVDHCIEEANIEATDPFVKDVECSELADGVLQLRFERREETSPPETASAETTG
ncbi:MAG: hypothetical protein AB1749_15655 [Pseudomonadota bacterium]